MKLFSILALYSLFFFSSHSVNPDKLLNDARSKMSGHQVVDFYQVGYYPTPTNKIVTRDARTQTSKNTESETGYDFIIKSERADVVYIDEIYQTVDHNEKTVELFPSNKPRVVAWEINNQRHIMYSPHTLLSETDWKYAGDTIAGEVKLEGFVRIENDKVVNGNTIYTEQYIFVNPDSKLIERFERRNYYKGELAQTVVYEYSDYNFDEGETPFTYDLPENYKSVLYGRSEPKNSLETGQKAPAFIGQDLENNPFNMLDHQGNKVLLNFSTINCGYCKLALDHFNSDDYELSDNISAFYVNPIDEKNELTEYFTQVESPFPVIPEAKEIAEQFGVTGYPTFVLIDENGIIEKVVEGYDKEFLESLRG